MQSDIRLNFSLNIQTDMTEVADIRLMRGDAQKFSELGDQAGGEWGHRARDKGVTGRQRRCSYEYKVC